MFLRLAEQHRKFVQDLVMNLQALAIVLEHRGYLASCYTCGGQMNSASFMVSLTDNHLIRFLVSDYGITWTEMRDDRELMKLEGAEARKVSNPTFGSYFSDGAVILAIARFRGRRRKKVGACLLKPNPQRVS